MHMHMHMRRYLGAFAYILMDSVEPTDKCFEVEVLSKVVVDLSGVSASTSVSVVVVVRMNTQCD